MTKKGLAVLLILLIIFSSISVLAATDSFTITCEKVSGSKQIVKGDIFIYKISVKNNTTVDINTVKGKISGDFATESSNYIDFSTIAAGNTATINVPMSYTGDSNRMNIYISGSNGENNYATVINSTISSAVKTDTTPPKPPKVPEPVNKDSDYADFKLILKDSTPTFYVGQPQTLEFDLENISNDYANEVGVQLVNNLNDFQFSDTVNPPSTNSKEIFHSKTKKNFSISFMVKESVPSGFYTIPAKITFKNIHGLPKEITKNISIEIVNKNVIPSLLLEEIKINTGKLIPGEKNSISLKLKNLSTTNIKNLNVTLKGLSIEGVTLDADKPQKAINKITDGGYELITYNVFVSDLLKSSRYELNLEVDYYDKSGKAYKEIIPVYLPTNQVETSIYDLDIIGTNISYNMIPDKEFTINFDVENKGMVSQKNLKLNINSEGDFIYKSQPTSIIDSIEVGENQSYSYTLIANKKMTTNNYPVYITIEKADGSSTNKVSEYIGIYVNNDEGSSTPKIIIDNLELNQEKIFAGQEFDLSFSIKNTRKMNGYLWSSNQWKDTQGS